MTSHVETALAHDYVTQRGGAERVAIMMAHAFPAAPLYTTLYEPSGTFPEFGDVDLRVSPLSGLALLRRDHRLAFPLLAPVVSNLTVDAGVLLASSSGWAHGISCTGRKVVYCHAPARWLYQRDRYLGTTDGLKPAARLRRASGAAAVGLLGAGLRNWDRRKAHAADRYLVNSTVIRQAVADAYDIEAEVLPPPPAMTPSGPTRQVAHLTRPFVLCVARLLPYKNVDSAIEAVRRVDGLDLVVVGKGPDRDRLVTIADGDPRIHMLGPVDDDELRWLYGRSTGLVAASYEDYGLSPLEAASFGRPTVALRAGGYLDTIVEGITGSYFDEPQPGQIAEALEGALARRWDSDAITSHADAFSEARFVDRLRHVVAEERIKP